MEKKGIVPKQVLEAEKRRIRHQLTNQKSLKSQGTEKKEAPEFFAEMQEKFVNKAIELGLEYTDIVDFIEEKGLQEASHDLLLDAINNPNYINKVYQKFQAQDASGQIGNEGALNYKYFDPMISKPLEGGPILQN